MKTALDRYNSLFDNQQYRAIGDHLAADLNVQRDAQIVSDALNVVTDAALGLCDHPSYTDSWLKLAAFCGTTTVTPQTIDMIHTYLLIFQQAHDTRADDFMLTAKALLKSNAALDLLKEGVSYANGVHSWRGRMAYHLLTAADYFVLAATQLLMDGDLSYIREKLRSGLQRLTGAMQEVLGKVQSLNKF